MSEKFFEMVAVVLVLGFLFYLASGGQPFLIENHACNFVGDFFQGNLITVPGTCTFTDTNGGSHTLKLDAIQSEFKPADIGVLNSARLGGIVQAQDYCSRNLFQVNVYMDNENLGRLGANPDGPNPANPDAFTTYQSATFSPSGYTVDVTVNGVPYGNYENTHGCDYGSLGYGAWMDATITPTAQGGGATTTLAGQSQTINGGTNNGNGGTQAQGATSGNDSLAQVGVIIVLAIGALFAQAMGWFK